MQQCLDALDRPGLDLCGERHMRRVVVEPVEDPGQLGVEFGVAQRVQLRFPRLTLSCSGIDRRRQPAGDAIQAGGQREAAEAYQGTRSSRLASRSSSTVALISVPTRVSTEASREASAAAISPVRPAV